VHRAWVNSIIADPDFVAGLDTDRRLIADHSADIVETLFDRPDGTRGALTRFGSTLGAEGWPLEQVSHWIDLLASHCPPTIAEVLRTFESGVALAHGWTEGSLRGLRAGECFDGVTGLCTPAVLRLRLQQVFDQCKALALEPNWMYRLLVVDADVGDSGRLEADAVMMVLADLVQRRFMAGETIARDGGRILALVRDSHQLEESVIEIVQASRTRSLLQPARVLAWVEDLPADASLIDRYMADLSV